jgi:hypothetical protein
MLLTKSAVRRGRCKRTRSKRNKKLSATIQYAPLVDKLCPLTLRAAK